MGRRTIEQIKKRLVCAPGLHMPNRQGRLHLYSDTSKFAVGSALYQIQDSKLKLTAYASKDSWKQLEVIQ